MSVVLSGADQQANRELHVVLEAGTIKVGTCEHCAVREYGRPDRAWNPDGQGYSYEHGLPPKERIRSEPYGETKGTNHRR
jgi:hypothetical protein